MPIDLSTLVSVPQLVALVALVVLVVVLLILGRQPLALLWDLRPWDHERQDERDDRIFQSMMKGRQTYRQNHHNRAA